MLSLLQHLGQTTSASKDRLALEDNLKRYLATDLRVVNHQKQVDLPDPLGSAVAWGLSLSTHDFYRQLGDIREH